MSMVIFLQLWGGIAYLLSKILIVRAEFLENDRNIRFIGLASYLVGMPAFVTLLISRQNWIATAIEIATIPSLVFGMVLTWKKSNTPKKYIDWSIRIFTCIMILTGISLSVYTFNGIRTFSQILELVIIFGSLASAYLLAKRNPFAWLMFMLGHISVGLLMYIQDNYILFIQQLLSLILVTIGLVKGLKKANYFNSGGKNDYN